MFADEIRFRELPWGIPASKVMPLLPGLFCAPIVKKEECSFVSLICDSTNAKMKEEPQKFSHGGLALIAAAESDKEGLAVAGYTTKSSCVYFALVPENGRLKYDADHSAFYAGKYRFEKKVDVNTSGWLKVSKEDAGKKCREYADYFLEQLILLYGNPDKQETLEVSEKYIEEYIKLFDDKPSNHQFTAYQWYGSNDTELVMVSEIDFSYSTQVISKVHIFYTTRKGDEYLKAADAAADPDSMIYKRLVMGAEWL